MRLAADIRVANGPFAVAAAIDAGPTDVIAVVGPNGAGKTTLLHGLAGLLPSDGAREVPAPVGVVFQDRRLFPHLTVRANVAFGGSAAVADRWLDRVGMAPKAGDKPSRLSGGEAQRVALARTLAHDPACLLLDEPFTALDVDSRAVIRREIERFAGPRVMVTHDPLDAAALATELVVLERGVVAQRGALSELTARPRSRYVAELVGINWLPGRADGDAVALDNGGRVVVAGALPATGPVAAVFHPRAVALYTDAPAGSPRNTLRGTVAALDRQHHRVRITIDWPPRVVAEVTPAAVSDLQLAPGREVWCVLKASEVTVTPL